MSARKPKPIPPAVPSVQHQAEVMALDAEMVCSREQMSLGLTVSQTEASLVQKLVDYATENNLVIGSEAHIEWTCRLTAKGHRWPEDGQEHPSIEVLRNAVSQTAPDEPVIVVTQA